jgi:hypothetical protein
MRHASLVVMIMVALTLCMCCCLIPGCDARWRHDRRFGFDAPPGADIGEAYQGAIEVTGDELVFPLVVMIRD